MESRKAVQCERGYEGHQPSKSNKKTPRPILPRWRVGGARPPWCGTGHGSFPAGVRSRWRRGAMGTGTVTIGTRQRNTYWYVLSSTSKIVLSLLVSCKTTKDGVSPNKTNPHGMAFHRWYFSLARCLVLPCVGGTRVKTSIRACCQFEACWSFRLLAINTSLGCLLVSRAMSAWLSLQEANSEL